MNTLKDVLRDVLSQEAANWNNNLGVALAYLGGSRTRWQGAGLRSDGLGGYCWGRSEITECLGLAGFTYATRRDAIRDARDAGAVVREVR